MKPFHEMTATDYYLEELRMLAAKTSHDAYVLADYVLKNDKFKIWTASAHPNVHHYGHGGLLKHTYEVVQLCMLNAEFFARSGKVIDTRLLMLAAVFHDFGKLWDYAPANEEMTEWKSTDDKYKIYHITRSVMAWVKATETIKHNLSPAEIDQVTHCILAHHGRHEYKSPAEPKDEMAWILHLCDNMSARVSDCRLRPLNPHTKPSEPTPV